MLDLLGVQAPAAAIDRYRRSGVWRRVGVVDDLHRWAASTPDAIALVSFREPDDVVRLSYGDYARRVEEFARSLERLGVQQGEVVSLWLPNRWELPALLLACWTVGAIAAPMMTTLGAREAERILRRVGAVACVTVDHHAEVSHSDLLADMAVRLPAMRHQVVLGAPGEGQQALDELVATSATSATPTDRRTIGPDAAAAILFTSGTTGAPKAAVHTLNTLFVAAQAARGPGAGPSEQTCTAHALAHTGGMAIALFGPLPLGASTLFLESWDPARAGELMATERTTQFAAAPMFIEQLLDTPAATGLRLPYLARITAIGAPVPAGLVTRVAEQLGRDLMTAWGMTEANNIFTRPDDPTGWAAHSVGRPADGLDAALRPAGGDVPAVGQSVGHLFVRGAGTCIATASRDGGPLTLVADRDDGWYDTGDLAVDDGRGGYRLVGRAVDRVGTPFMIPTLDVEEALRGHPEVADVALIGIERADGTEVPCAVITGVTPESRPTLESLRAFLLGQGMTEWYLPQRLELLESLPRNATGKVQKAELRSRLSAIQASEPSGERRPPSG